MNKVVSLPRINTHRVEISTNLASKQRKDSSDLNNLTVIDSVRDIRNHKIENEEDKNVQSKKRPNLSIKRVKSEFLKRSEEQTFQQEKQQKYGLKQNGKLSKIVEIASSLSGVIKTQRSIRSLSKPENQNKEKITAIRKQLNEVTSSMLILKKQIKAIEGSTIQLKQQSKSFFTAQSIVESNQKIEHKIEDLRKKTDSFRYDQQIFKCMKDRLKQVIIHYEKKTGNLKDTLQREEKKIKILNQRASVREESINKKKQLIKTIQQKQFTTKKMIQLEVGDYQKKIKQISNQRELNLKNVKSINADQYHLEVYKKQEAQLFEQLRASHFINQLLSIKWNKYSEMYADVQKAEKLLKMHSIEMLEEEFNPSKVYFGSLENTVELEKKIKENEARLAAATKKNEQLQKAWKNIEFNQTEEEQKTLNSKAMQIKTGKVLQHQVIEQNERKLQVQNKRKKNIAKQKASTMSEIKDWIIRLEKVVNISFAPDSKLEERLEEIIRRTTKSYKKRNDQVSKRN